MTKQGRRPQKLDENATGVTFIDLLFALAVGKILEAGFDVRPSIDSMAHLTVAFVLTITSWVGYHNSVNRSRHFLMFWNLPLWLFVVDVLLVLDYWLIPALAVHPEGSPHQPDARLVTVVVAAAFGLYTIWDYLALMIRRSKKYPRRPNSKDLPGRRLVSLFFFIGSAVLAAGVVCTHPVTVRTVVGIDVVLVVVLLAYRTAKEWATPADALTPGP